MVVKTCVQQRLSAEVPVGREKYVKKARPVRLVPAAGLREAYAYGAQRREMRRCGAGTV